METTPTNVPVLVVSATGPDFLTDDELANHEPPWTAEEDRREALAAIETMCFCPNRVPRPEYCVCGADIAYYLYQQADGCKPILPKRLAEKVPRELCSRSQYIDAMKSRPAGLTKGQRKVALAMVSLAADEAEPRCYASTETIAEAALTSVRTVKRALSVLRRDGYLTELERVSTGQKRKPVVYGFTVPTEKNFSQLKMAL